MKISEYAKYCKTEDYLFKNMANRIKSRKPIYITLEELIYITFWKSPRNLHFILINNNATVKEISRAALSIKDEVNKIKTLTKGLGRKRLKGVGVAIASAILTILNPNRYGVIDFHAWRALYGEKRSNFSLDDYLRYLNDLRQKAQEEKTTPREIDKGLLIKDTGIVEKIRKVNM